MSQRLVDDIAGQESIETLRKASAAGVGTWWVAVAWRRWESVGLLGAFVIMAGMYAVLSPHFLTLRNVSNVLLQSAALLFLACGQTLAILSAGLDLSQGSVVSLVSVVTAQTIKYHGIWAGTVAGLGVAALAGLTNGLLVGMAGIQPFIVTLGMFYIAAGAAMLYVNGSSVFGLPEPDVSRWFWFGGGYIGPVPVPAVLAALGVLVMHYLLTRTRFGRHVYAVGGNEQVARLSGIDVGRVKVWIYTLSALFAGIGGYILSARVISGQPLLGAGSLLLQSIGAVVIGGTSLFGGEGSVLRTVMGVLFVAFMVNGLNLLAVSTFVQEIVIGALIVVSVWISQTRRR